MKKRNMLIILSALLILIFVSTVFSIQEDYIGFSQIWSTRMWEEAIYRKLNTDLTYFSDKEWPRLKELGANTIQNHVGNENTHIQSFSDLELKVIAMQYPKDDNGDIWIDDIYYSPEGSYATATTQNEAIKWPFHYTLQRYTDDGYSWLLLKLEETITAMQDEYSFGSEAFAGYDFAQETWQGFHTQTELDRAFEIIDHGVEHIRKRDIINPIRISMCIVDPIRRSLGSEIMDPDPFATYNAVKPFLADQEGSGWNIYTNFQYYLLDEDYVVEHLGQDRWESYFGFHYQDRLDRKLNGMLQGSRWVHDYAREFYENGHQGPEPFWVECIQAQKTYSFYQTGIGNECVYKVRQRRPRTPEYKINAYLALIAGARGVAFWPYNGSEKDTDETYVLENGSVLDEKPEYDLLPMQSQSEDILPIPASSNYMPYFRDRYRGIIKWTWNGHTDETFRTKIENEDVSGRFNATPFNDIRDAFRDEIKERLPIINSLDWVWAVTGESDPTETNGPGVVRAMNSFTPRPGDYPNTLDTYFNLRNVLGDEELDNGDPLEEKTSNAKVGLFLNGTSPGVQYYLVLNSRCNQKNVNNRIIDASSDAFQFVFKTEPGQSYKLYDVFTNTLLWQVTASGNSATTGSITFQPGEARLLKFINGNTARTMGGSYTGINTIGNSDGTPSHYQMTSSVTVNGAGNLLTIYPNTTIEVEGFYSITTNNGGRIEFANPDETKPVIFKPSANALNAATNKRDVWYGIAFWSGANIDPADTVKNIDIHNARYGIVSYQDQQHFRNISAESCTYGMVLAQVTPFNSTDSKSVLESKFKNCQYGVNCTNSNDLLLRKMWIEESEREGLILSNMQGDVQVEDSHILHSGRHGVKILNQVSGSIFIGDTTNVLYNGCGSDVTAYSGIFVNNASYFVLGNRLSIDRNTYTGLNLDGNADCIVLGVEIAENGIKKENQIDQSEIYISGTSHIIGPSTWGPNAIYDDLINMPSVLIRCDSDNNSIYDLYDGANNFYIRYKDETNREPDASEFYPGIMIPEIKPDGYFLSSNTPSDLLALAKTEADSGNFETAIGIIENLILDYPNETISCVIQSYLYNLYYQSGSSPQQIIDDLQRFPSNMTAYSSIFNRHWLIANYLTIKGDLEDAKQKFIEISELAETASDSIKALIACEEVAIQALMLDMDNSGGRTTSSTGYEDKQRMFTIENHQENIDALYQKLYGREVNTRRDLIPQESKLQAAYPNPFNPSVTIPFALNKTQDIKISIYNILGQKVVELVNEQKVAGQHSIVWHGISDHGIQVSSGIYFILLQTADGIDTRKIVMLK